MYLRDALNIEEALHLLVTSFDCDNGLPENAYIATKMLVRIHMGEEATELFVRCVEATDGAFYCDDGAEVWEEMCNLMKEAKNA